MSYAAPTVVSTGNFPGMSYSSPTMVQAAPSYTVAQPTYAAPTSYTPMAYSTVQPAVYSTPTVVAAPMIQATHTHYQEATHSVIPATVAPPATYVDTQPTGAVYTPTYMPDMASLTQYAYGNPHRGDTFTNTSAYTPKADKIDSRINSKFTPEHPGAFHPGYRVGCGLGYLNRYPALGSGLNPPNL
eukprot:NODE_7799_length_742_cov_108.523425_g7548_i0.p1 GENE.NODE_7799_length_742_cov_108.523425_g7548_i0~~NODE_7799_length_742_cov_108.523425_g7548_i0.p1  ORF type:complete len:205 (+),score=51.02 NODE_7799_length_742_cov_108.523425_g7548_i0:59-616(+)